LVDGRFVSEIFFPADADSEYQTFSHDEHQQKNTGQLYD
jgi:hypothetical protein